MNQQELVDEAQRLAAGRITEAMDTDQKMTVLEGAMMELLDLKIMTPSLGRISNLAGGGYYDMTGPWQMGNDPRLPEMPSQPNLIDFFELRILLDTRGGNHLLQSAALAQEKGLPDKTVLACLLHDISVISMVRTDHGHWGAQLVAPYVDEEVAWAIKHHQALRFLADPELDYEYPASYFQFFGEQYEPPPYIKAEWEYCRGHRWYESAMQICLNDLYSFDPDKVVEIGEFTDIIGRTFRQPEEGLGFDSSPVAHMWRTIIWPNNFL